MYVVCVTSRVKPGFLDGFIAESLENARATRGEPGNVRFDVLRSVEDPTRFVLYEAYVDEAAARAHKETAHYLVWRERVAPWLAEPRVGVPYEGLG